MTNIPSTEEFEEIRNQKFAKSVRKFIREQRDSDRLLAQKHDAASPKHQRPSLKRGKHIRRDASINLADVLIDLEAAVQAEKWDEARVLYYQAKKFTP